MHAIALFQFNLDFGPQFDELDDVDHGLSAIFFISSSASPNRLLRLARSANFCSAVSAPTS